MLSIQLQNTVTKQVYEFSDVEDKNNGKKLFYKFNLNLTDVPEGEYEVTLYEDGEVIKKELLKLGDFNNKGIQYSKGNSIFIDAKPEIKLRNESFVGGGRWRAETNEGWKEITMFNEIKCGLLNYKMHNLPYENFEDASGGYGPNTDKWWGQYSVFTTGDVTDFENFFMNCPNLKYILISANEATNMKNMVDTPQNIQDLWITYLGCSFSYTPYTNINHIDSINHTLFDVQVVLNKEEKPILNLSKYITLVDENAIANAVAKGWLIVGVNIIPEYRVDLNNEWEISDNIPNPNNEIYDGVYQSFSNYHIAGGKATMHIDIENYDDFTFYIRSYAEGSFDYINVYDIDKTSGNIYATTKDNQNGGTNIESYIKVVFNNLSLGKHRIYIEYKKDGSQDINDDRGYVLIPKQQ